MKPSILELMGRDGAFLEKKKYLRFYSYSKGALETMGLNT